MDHTLTPLTCYDFWSFFDYKILGAIITSFCFDLKPDFDVYVLNFKEYCNRRVCEVPDDSYSTKLSKSEEKKNLHIKLTRILWMKSRS